LKINLFTSGLGAEYTNSVHSLQVCVKSLSGQGISAVKSLLAKPHFLHLLNPRIYMGCPYYVHKSFAAAYASMTS